MTTPLGRLVCEYCGRQNSGRAGNCAHCGAPLVEHVVHAAEAEGKHVLGNVERNAVPIAAAAAGEVVDKVVTSEGKELRTSLVWLAVAAGLVLLVVFGHRFGGKLFSEAGSALAPVAADAGQLPGMLHDAAQCASAASSGQSSGGQYDDNSSTTTDFTTQKQCVIHPSDPVLSGLSAGRPVTLTVRRIPHGDAGAAAAAAVRSSGQTIEDDSFAIIATDSSAAVHYFSPASGLRIDTTTFSSIDAARTFLTRTGLLPPSPAG
jgi:hypothetical protein